MKSIPVFSVCVFLFVAVAGHTELQQRFVQNAMNCKVKHGIEDIVLQNPDWETLNGHSGFKDFLVCVGNQENFLDGSGIAQREQVKGFMRENLEVLGLGGLNVDEVVEKCIVEHPEPREAAFMLFRCTYENVGVPFKFPN